MSTILENFNFFLQKRQFYFEEILYIRVDSSTKGENSLSLKKTQRGNAKRNKIN